MVGWRVKSMGKRDGQRRGNLRITRFKVKVSRGKTKAVFRRAVAIILFETRWIRDVSGNIDALNGAILLGNHWNGSAHNWD